MWSSFIKLVSVERSIVVLTRQLPGKRGKKGIIIAKEMYPLTVTRNVRRFNKCPSVIAASVSEYFLFIFFTRLFPALFPVYTWVFSVILCVSSFHHPI